MFCFADFAEVSRELEALFREAVPNPRVEELIPTFIHMHQEIVAEIEQALVLAYPV